MGRQLVEYFKKFVNLTDKNLVSEAMAEFCILAIKLLVLEKLSKEIQQYSIAIDINKQTKSMEIKSEISQWNRQLEKLRKDFEIFLDKTQFTEVERMQVFFTFLNPFDYNCTEFRYNILKVNWNNYCRYLLERMDL